MIKESLKTEDAKQVYCFCFGMIFMMCVFIGAGEFFSEKQSADQYYQHKIEMIKKQLVQK